MAQQEGVIKFQLEHTPADPLSWEQLSELNTWREWMVARALIGEIETPKGKVGYGNISSRFKHGFVITGSQTGHLPHLTPSDYAFVVSCTPDQNRVVSQGPVQPSSESLTHGVLYQLDSAIRWVMHAHHSPIWKAAKELDLPLTSQEVAYGTPEMAAETRRLFAETDVYQKRIFAMAGHQDGIISFGEDAVQAADVLEHYLERTTQ